MTRAVPWPRILAEGLVIVVSVLLALGADAWWDDRKEAAEEGRRLAAVRVELTEAQASYDELLETITRRTAYISEVMQQSNEYSGAESKLDSLFFRLGPLTDPTPSTVALEDAVSGGALGLIKSAEIRTTLGRYNGAVERMQDEVTAIRDRFESELSYNYQYINLRRQMATSPSDAFDVGLPDVPLQPRYVELLRDRRFLNQLVGQAALLSRLRLRTEEAITVTRELIALLDREGYGL